jgi:hypothetical protein
MWRPSSSIPRPEECHHLAWENVNWDAGRHGTVMITRGKTKAAQRLFPMTLLPAHVPDPLGRVSVRRLDSGTDRRALQLFPYPSGMFASQGTRFYWPCLGWVGTILGTLKKTALPAAKKNEAATGA